MSKNHIKCIFFDFVNRLFGHEQIHKLLLVTSFHKPKQKLLPNTEPGQSACIMLAEIAGTSNSQQVKRQAHSQVHLVSSASFSHKQKLHVRKLLAAGLAVTCSFSFNVDGSLVRHGLDACLSRQFASEPDDTMDKLLTKKNRPRSNSGHSHSAKGFSILLQCWLSP